jgi:hypothetical protein
MSQQSLEKGQTLRRYALCVGIGEYTNLPNHNLRYAVDDANVVADQLEQKGDYIVRRLTLTNQTTKEVLNRAVEHLLSAPERQENDLAVLYFSCHGTIEPGKKTFCLLPSGAALQADGRPNPETSIGISDLTRWLSNARMRNIVILLDVCHSGGAGVALQQLKLDLAAGPNIFIIGGARQDQAAMQSSHLKHGLFTNCLIRAFGQPPTRDGWLTVSQIQNFVSDEIQCFAKDHPIQIQSWSVSVESPSLLRNPGYPELYPLPPLWHNVPTRNRFFTGQDKYLSDIFHELHNEQMALTQPYAISGLGGIGKTQLALEYAYRYRQCYKAVLWGKADSRGALTTTFVNIALYLLTVRLNLDAITRF